MRLIGYMVRLLSENRQATSTNAPMMTVAPTALQAMLNGLLMAISSYRAFTVQLYRERMTDTLTAAYTQLTSS